MKAMLFCLDLTRGECKLYGLAPIQIGDPSLTRQHNNKDPGGGLMEVRFPETEASFSFKVNLPLDVTHTKNHQLTNCIKFEIAF